MEKLIIQGTKSTPYVCFDQASDTFTIRGESYPENTAAFFTPVFAWLEEFLTSEQSQRLVLDFELLYFNSSSSKALFNMFSMFERFILQGKEISVNWRYQVDNDTVKECGEEFKEDAPDLEFNLVEIEKSSRSWTV
ncbi:MAG: DUF1987 domain-containing protein [Nitrospirae bacterium]|nr:DUF1987 domain-containing protein [Nitrospirota bacterium]